MNLFYNHENQSKNNNDIIIIYNVIEEQMAL